MFHQLIQHKRDLPVDDEVAFTYDRVLRNLTSKQTTIKLGPHRGEEMYVLNNACQDYLL